MRVLVTGGTGFLGHEVVSRLVQAGHQVHVLTRRPSEFRQSGAEPVAGNIADIGAWEERLRTMEACVHLIGILRENRGQGVTFEKLHYQATVDLLRACGKTGVTRFIHVSANGVEKGLNIPYMRTKATAEQAVRSSNLPWTILRPSIIYGGDPGRANFVDMLKGYLDRGAWFPYFGDGSYRLAPISAREVAWAIVNCLANPETVGNCYHLCGSETYTYKALLLLLNQTGNYRCGLFSLPLWLMTNVSSLLSGIPGFPVTPDMLRMLAAGNDCPSGAPTQKDLGVTELSFKDWLTTGVLPEYPQAIPLSGQTPAVETPALNLGVSITKELKSEELEGAINTQPLNPGEAP